MALDAPPVITIDGPAAAGKGSVARRVAAALGFHYLDSGKGYRAVALAMMQQKTPINQAATAVTALSSEALTVLTQSPDILTDDVAAVASQIATVAAVRTALAGWQHAARQPPGLVADGRDMGSVIFPDATVKFFLTATHTVRAERRQQQLRQHGICVKIGCVLADIKQRDQRDLERSGAPLVCPVDATTIDTTHLTEDEVARIILQRFADTDIPKQNPQQ